VQLDSGVLPCQHPLGGHGGTNIVGHQPAEHGDRVRGSFHFHEPRRLERHVEVQNPQQMGLGDEEDPDVVHLVAGVGFSPQHGQVAAVGKLEQVARHSHLEVTV